MPVLSPDGEEYVLTKEAAEAMGVSPCTVTQWRNRGYLRPVEGSPPRKPLYRMRDVEDAEHQARLNAIRTSGSDRKVRRQRGGGELWPPGRCGTATSPRAGTSA